MKSRTTLNLSIISIGFLRYLKDIGDANEMADTIDILVAAYMREYADQNEISYEELEKKAIRFYESTRLTYDEEAKRKQESMIEQAMKRVEKSPQIAEPDKFDSYGNKIETERKEWEGDIDWLNEE